MSNTMIYTNILAMNALRNLKSLSFAQARSMARLSSGLRINSAADDASGLAISEKMRAQIRGLDMASRNAQDGISLIQTAEGGLQGIDDMLQRIRELVVQASSDTNEWDVVSGGDRQKIQDEINSLVAEIDGMVGRTQFNNKTLLDGSLSAKHADPAAQAAYSQAKANYDAALTKQVKAADAVNRELNDPTDAGFANVFEELRKTDDYKNGVITKAVDEGYRDISLAIDKAKGASAGSSAADITQNISNVSTAAASFAANIANLTTSTAVSDAMSKVTTAVSAVSTKLTELGDAVNGAITAKDNFNAAQKTYLADQNKTQGLYFQVGANANQKIQVSIGGMDTASLGIGDGNGNATIDVVRASGRDITDILNTVDKALTKVTSERSRLGATQNRMEYTIRSLDISYENLTAAESRIRDVDVAKEMMNLARINILQQATIAMLAQANQSPEFLLKLLTFG